MNDIITQFWIIDILETVKDISIGIGAATAALFVTLTVFIYGPEKDDEKLDIKTLKAYRRVCLILVIPAFFIFILTPNKITLNVMRVSVIASQTADYIKTVPEFERLRAIIDKQLTELEKGSKP